MNWSPCRKKKAGTLSYLTASIPLVAYMESLKRDKGADWVRVPFKGGGEATNAILSGTTPIGLYGLGNVISQIKAGKMTPLALVNNIRTPQMPNVPTLADIGYKGSPSQTWYGLFAPKGTPKAIIDKLNKEIAGHRHRSGIHRKIRHIPRHGAGHQHAGGIRQGDQGKSRGCKAGGEGERVGGAVTTARATFLTVNPEMPSRSEPRRMSGPRLGRRPSRRACGAHLRVTD